MVHPGRSADLTQFTPWYWNSHHHGLISLGRMQRKLIICNWWHSYSSNFVPPGTHYCWVAIGNVDSKLALRTYTWPVESNTRLSASPLSHALHINGVFPITINTIHVATNVFNYSTIYTIQNYMFPHTCYFVILSNLTRVYARHSSVGDFPRPCATQVLPDCVIVQYTRMHAVSKRYFSKCTLNCEQSKTI